MKHFKNEEENFVDFLLDVAEENDLRNIYQMINHLPSYKIEIVKDLLYKDYKKYSQIISELGVIAG